MAISGPGFFRVRNESGIFYTREGHFQLKADGTVTTPNGFVLQQADGNDLILDGTDVEILPDGMVMDDGRPVGQIGVFAPTEAVRMTPIAGSLFTADERGMEASRGGQLRQGMVEGSNVDLGEEMVTMMTAVRDAESGARLIQVYDDLIGRAITTFGQGAR